MVGVNGARISNLNPPTLAAVTFGIAQCGLALLLRDRLVLLAGRVPRLYVDHAALFRCDDPGRVDGEVRSATVNGLKAGLLRYAGFEYDAVLEPTDAPTAVTVTRGSGTMTTAGEELCFAR